VGPGSSDVGRGTHALRDSPDRMPEIVWALNANSSKMATDTEFKFGTHAPRDSPDRMPQLF